MPLDNQLYRIYSFCNSKGKNSIAYTYFFGDDKDEPK